MHTPVLLKEVIEVLNPQPGEFFIDGTLGGGGHATEIIKRISPDGIFLGVDLDKEAIEKLGPNLNTERLKAVKLINANYADLPEILEREQLGKADGLLLDLGFSSETLESGRGFSFLKNEPLDMRYDTTRGEPADIVLNYKTEEELTDIFWKYGEERFGRRIAKRIVAERKIRPIKTTFALVKLILSAKPRPIFSRIHPATKVFQALRIYVNDELGNLEKLLKNLNKIIKDKGRTAIISFHSLEDRLVKNYFRDLKSQGKAEILTNPEGKPLASYGAGKPITPSREEISANPRSRSAKLRAIML